MTDEDDLVQIWCLRFFSFKQMVFKYGYGVHLRFVIDLMVDIEQNHLMVQKIHY